MKPVREGTPKSVFCILGGSSALDLPPCGGTPVWWNPPHFRWIRMYSKSAAGAIFLRNRIAQSHFQCFLACESLLWWGTAQSSFVEPLVEPPTKIPFGGTLYVTGVLPIIVGRHMSQVRCDWWNPCLELSDNWWNPRSQGCCSPLTNWWFPWLPVD